MRPDQLQRLNDLSEKLADVFLEEADPQTWNGAGQAVADMSTEDRGNRYWCKKNAMATGGVLRYTLDLIQHHKDRAPGDPEQDADMDARIRDAERRTKKVVEDAMKRAALSGIRKAAAKPAARQG